MKTLTLKIKNINDLNNIQKALSKNKSLTNNQQTILNDFLIQLPSANLLLTEKVPLNESFEVKAWNKDIWAELDKWEALFYNLPGWDFCPTCYIVDNDDIDALRKNILLVSVFAPSYAYNVETSR